MNAAQEQQEVSDKALRRIRKMLALANDAAATEGERDNALRMAYATLAKHNLDMSDVQESEMPAEEARVQEETINAADIWAAIVSKAIAELFFCRHFTYSRRVGAHKKRHCFVGRQSNVQAAISMADHLIKSIDREAGIRMRALNELYPWRRSFSLGAAHKIHERVRQMRESATTEPGTGIVLASFYAREKAANDALLAGMRFAKGNCGRNATADGYYNGQSFGAGVVLSKQVGGPSAPRSQLCIGRQS